MLKEFLSFVFKLKIPKSGKNYKVSKKIFLTLILSFLVIPLTIFFAIFSGSIEQKVNPNLNIVPNSQTEVENHSQDKSLFSLVNNLMTLFALGVIFAPVVEELVFRKGLLKADIPYYLLVLGFILNTKISGAFLPKNLVDAISSNIIFEILFAFTKAFMLIGGLYFIGKIVAKKFININANLINFGKKNIKIFILVSSLMFALLHANNNGFFTSE